MSAKVYWMTSILLIVSIIGFMKHKQTTAYQAVRDAAAKQWPLAAYVVDKYDACLSGDLFSSGNQIECQSSVITLVRTSKGEAAAQQALQIMEDVDARRKTAIW